MPEYKPVLLESVSEKIRNTNQFNPGSVPSLFGLVAQTPFLVIGFLYMLNNQVTASEFFMRSGAITTFFGGVTLLMVRFKKQDLPVELWPRINYVWRTFGICMVVGGLIFISLMAVFRNFLITNNIR